MPDDNGEARTVTRFQLHASPIVHQAIGILMERHGTSIEDAFSTLREAADRKDLPIVDISLAVVNSVHQSHTPAGVLPLITLTPRELEILRELPTRSTVEEIAMACFVS